MRYPLQVKHAIFNVPSGKLLRVQVNIGEDQEVTYLEEVIFRKQMRRQGAREYLGEITTVLSDNRERGDPLQKRVQANRHRYCGMPTEPDFG